MPIEEFQYRLRWRSRAQRPGSHAATHRGVGLEFHGLAPIVSAGDPRRIDLRASARDPFGQLLVRIYTQPSAVPIYALVDLSASMGFRGAARKLDTAADFIAALGHSAARVGDPVGLFGCDDEIRAALTRPLGLTRAGAEEIATRLREHEPVGDEATALLRAASLVPPRRALVFVLSDFYFSLDLVSGVLDRLARHDVVPVVLRDGAELRLPGFGLARVRDAETGRQRSLLLRRRFADRMLAASRAHDAALTRCFAATGSTAITLGDGFDAALVTRHFYG